MSPFVPTAERAAEWEALQERINRLRERHRLFDARRGHSFHTEYKAWKSQFISPSNKTGDLNNGLIPFQPAGTTIYVLIGRMTGLWLLHEAKDRRDREEEEENTRRRGLTGMFRSPTRKAKQNGGVIAWLQDRDINFVSSRRNVEQGRWVNHDVLVILYLLGSLTSSRIGLVILIFVVGSDHLNVRSRSMVAPWNEHDRSILPKASRNTHSRVHQIRSHLGSFRHHQ